MGGSGARESDRARLLGFAKRVVFAVLRYSGAAYVARHTVQERRVTIVAYHDPDPATFERTLAALASRYSFISLEAFLAARRAGDLGTLPRRSLVVTIDDGWMGNVLLLPSLERYGVRPTVFLSTSVVGTNRHFWWAHASGQVERDAMKGVPEEQRLQELTASGFAPDTPYPDRQALSIEELARMGTQVDFQSHSRTHPILTNCTDQQAWREIAGSADELRSLTGAPARAFAYPNGVYSERVIDLVREAGYECAVTIEPGYDDATTDPYRLKRLPIGDEAGVTELVARASGVYGVLVTSVRGLFG